MFTSDVDADFTGTVSGRFWRLELASIYNSTQAQLSVVNSLEMVEKENPCLDTGLPVLLLWEHTLDNELSEMESTTSESQVQHPNHLTAMLNCHVYWVIGGGIFWLTQIGWVKPPEFILPWCLHMLSHCYNIWQEYIEITSKQKLSICSPLNVLCAKYPRNQSTYVDTMIKWTGGYFLTHLVELSY